MKRLLLALVLSLFVGPATADLLGPTHAHMFERWVLIDTDAGNARIYQGDVAIVEFERIAIGSRGAARMRLAGDNTTPLGEFRIDRINRGSRFHIFLGLDYPTLAHVERALEHELIDRDEYWDIFNRMLKHGRVPQNTILGGHIGIHGLGQGDPQTHEMFDWTQGCVALTNEQVEKLAEFVTIGTRVVIR